MARYRVKLAPGAYLGPGRGLIPAGSELELPDDTVPSSTFEPLDEAAVQALARRGVKAQLAAPSAKEAPAQAPQPEKPVGRASDRKL